MPRGRQYYDPIVQVPGMVEGEQDLSRIEVFMDEGLKWWGRQVASDGSLTGNKVGDFNHDALLARVHEAWPTHPVYELRNESDDSTWEGHGPSPRLWQNSVASGELIQTFPESAVSEAIPPAVQQTVAPDPGYDDLSAPVEIRPLIIPAGGIKLDFPEGIYLPLDEICALLESWAVSFEIGKNPSGAMALREAANALKDIR